MTGRSLIISLTSVAVVLAIGMCTDVGPRKVPPPLKDEARIQYRVQMVIDSARVRELEAENLRLARVAASEIGRAKKSDSIAADARDAADSIASAAYRASKTADKAQLWEEAAHTYRQSADAAVMASKTKDSALVVRDSQIVRKDSVISAEHARRTRAERRVTELEPLAMRADDCKIARFVNCPTRKQAFVAGAVVATTAIVLAREALARSKD
jgi:hypothetical protein